VNGFWRKKKKVVVENGGGGCSPGGARAKGEWFPLQPDHKRSGGVTEIIGYRLTENGRWGDAEGTHWKKPYRKAWGGERSPKAKKWQMANQKKYPRHLTVKGLTWLTRHQGPQVSEKGRSTGQTCVTALTKKREKECFSNRTAV